VYIRSKFGNRHAAEEEEAAAAAAGRMKEKSGSIILAHNEGCKLESTYERYNLGARVGLLGASTDQIRVIYLASLNSGAWQLTKKPLPTTVSILRK
jgi:hypothetical protein